MEYAKKMVLVEPRQIEKWKETPSEKVPSRLDGEIYSILNKDITDDEKAKLYTTTVTRYLNIDKPTVKTYFNQEPEKEEQKPPANDVETQVLQSVPKTRQATASRLMNHIKGNPNVKFNEKGELVVRGKVVPNTHAVDLVNDLLRKRVNVDSPKGWKDLASALKEGNIPRELIGNKDRLEFINEEDVITPESTPRKKNPPYCLPVYKTAAAYTFPIPKRDKKSKTIRWEPY